MFYLMIKHSPSFFCIQDFSLELLNHLTHFLTIFQLIHKPIFPNYSDLVSLFGRAIFSSLITWKSDHL